MRLDLHKVVDNAKHLSIFLSCVFFPFWTQLENSTTKGEKKPCHQIHHKKTMETSFQVFLLRAIIKNHFCLFWLPSSNPLKKCIAMLFYFILFFRNMSNEDHFFHPKNQFLYVSKKSYFIFWGQKNSKICLHQPAQPKNGTYYLLYTH